MSTTKKENFDDEELIPQCIEIMRSEGEISVSLLQRRLTLGYTRAAKLMAELESRGYIGPYTGKGLRDILIDLDSANVPPAGSACGSLRSPALPSTLNQEPSTGTSHNDRAISMTKSARKAACKKAGEAWARARTANEVIGQQRIEQMNAFREAGEHINVACGREQLLFTVDGNIFCREQLLPDLPADMSIEAVKGCVHIANKMERPVTTVAEVDDLQKRFQEELQLIGLLPSPRVRELQKAHTKDFFNHFVSVFSSAKTTLADLEKPEDEGGLGPMPGWSRAVLDDFLENAQPVKEQIERAEKLKLGK